MRDGAIRNRLSSEPRTPDANSMSDSPPPNPAPPAKLTPAGRKFPCGQCGARLDYDPRASRLKCPYCGHDQAVVTDEAAEIVERDYLDALGRADAKSKAIPGHGTETKCPGCGAVVILDDTVAADACPFCTTHLETTPVAVEGLLPPESLIAFAVDLRGAREAFAAWIESRWFAPTELKTVLALGRLVGVYLPYWTYDSDTSSSYEGERGDDYQELVRYTERLADGRSEDRTRTVTRTRWTSASGTVECAFDDLLVPATASLTADRLAEIGDYQLKKLTPFDAAYLSGFQAERYSVGLKEGFQVAKEMMQPEIVRAIEADIGGDHQRVHGKRTRYSAITFKHVLLPAWVAAYRYNAKVYQVTVNGQTGRVSGERPWSASKLAAVALAVAVAVALVATAAMVFNR